MEQNSINPGDKSNKIFLDAPLIGGAFMAVLSIIPIINLFNLLCCMWLVLGGVISFIYVNKKEEYVGRPSDGLIYGVLSGIFGWIFSIVLGFLMIAVRANRLLLIKEKLSQIGGPEAEKITQLLSRLGVIGIFFVFYMFFLVFYLIFPTIGGAVAQSLSKKKEVTPQNKKGE